MLEDMSGSLWGSNFVDLYNRMAFSLRCTRRNSNGASQHTIYDSSPMPPVMVLSEATLEYGAAGALGNITIIKSGGSSRTHTMSSFLVEVGGYAIALHHGYSCGQALMPCFRKPQLAAPPEIHRF